MVSDQTLAMPVTQAAAHCIIDIACACAPREQRIIDIVGGFVRVSCPTVTDRPRDRDRQTEAKTDN